MGDYEEYGYDKAEGEVVRVSEKAILFQEQDREGNNIDKPYWLPKSVLHDNSEVWKLGDVGMIVVKEWWARKQEWIE